jgi:hypothetical protein
MTELLINAASRVPLRRLARPSVVLAFGLVIAYLGGLWLTVLHAVEGGHERNEPPLLVHALRDGTLALPLVCSAVWVGILVARRIIERGRLEGSRILSGSVLAVTVAAATSIAAGLTNPLHAGLFGAQHAGPEPPLLIHMARDGLIALAMDLVLAGLVSAALLRVRPWAAPQVERWREGRAAGVRVVLQAAVVLVLVAPLAIFASTGAELAGAEAGPGTPCPSQAPLKTFDVDAIDVDIPLNRFGDHDPEGKMYVLADDVAAARAQERSRHVSLGLRADPIQPLVIRANLGDCVQITFRNRASGGEYGIHIDGVAFDVASSGDAVGQNTSSSAAAGETRTYRFWVPRDAEFEGAHYIRPGPGARQAVAHGLFGALSVQPAGSTYTSMDTGKPVTSGWEATISPGTGKAFREYVQLYHEIGDEDFRVLDSRNAPLPRVDPHTEAYRPGARAINYRSEPFMRRLDKAPQQESQAYGSYAFGDPATPTPRGYQGDPTKMRIVHAGSEVFHVYHLHGGGIRWRLNPHADKTYDYADTGLDKRPKTQQSPSSRLDSQAFGPGESYDLEIEGGAGGVQQGAGEFLQHCHIAEHYVAGMWNFWRVYDTLQPDLDPLPDRAPLPKAVDSRALIGKTMADGTTLTADNVDEWIRPQLPPPGTRVDDQDATVWNWTVQTSTAGPLYLGEPEDKGPWADLTGSQDAVRLPDHPGLYPVDEPVGPDDRPKLLFNPRNGRPAFPLMRPQIGKRPPFSPNGHSGAPYLGERGDKPPDGAGPDPWANRPDGICPAGAPVRTFNVVAIERPIQVTAPSAAQPAGGTDPAGKIYVLAKDADAVLAGTKPAQPLAIRSNIGECIAVTLTSRLTDANATGGFSKVNMHIHHVQFDTQASDGVISGMSFEQSVRPFSAADVQLSAPVTTGDTSIPVSSVAPKLRPGVWIAVGQGRESIEVRQIESVDTSARRITLTRALDNDHAGGEWAGTEFARSRWYPDVALDNIFWHDHVDGIHTWGRGLVGQLIIEPAGSTYHDPKTGSPVDSGTLVDIHTPNPLAPGLVDGSFRELALWTIDESPVTDSTLNLRAAPWADRLASDPDPSLLFSSYTHGDPNTPLPRAYAGDPFVIRTINVGPQVDTLHLDGHRFFTENRYRGPDGKVESTPTDTLHYGVSERYTAMLDGGAGGAGRRPGDYLFMNGIGRRFRQGAWGILRVLERKAGDLQPLPGVAPPPGGAFTPPARTGGRPPEGAGPGDPCPDDAPARTMQVSAVDVPGLVAGRRAAFVPTADAADVESGHKTPEPLVAHVAAGTCLTVDFSNRRASERASFHVGELDRTAESSGVNVGFNAEQTVPAGGRRTYRLHADTRKIGSAVVSDLGGNDTGVDGLYGAVVVAPSGATFTDPASGRAVQFGAQVDVRVPGHSGYRDFTVTLADDDPIIGGSFMPYPADAAGPMLLNLRTARSTPVQDDASAFSSKAHGDPATPLLRAYAGDPVKVHTLVAPGSEQMHVMSLGGQPWRSDPEIGHGNLVTAQGVGPWETFDAELHGGAGGVSRTRGDFFFGDLRRPFTTAGMWGLMRVMSDASCPIKPLDGLTCLGQDTLAANAPAPPPRPGQGPPAPGSAPAPAGARPGPAPTTGSAPARRPAKPTARGPRGLRLRRAIGLRELAARGLRFALLTPADTRAVQVRLYRVGRRRLTNVLQGVVRVTRGGAITVGWRPGARRVAALPPGQYVLRVRIGPRATRLTSRSTEASIRLTGPRVTVPTTRRPPG